MAKLAFAIDASIDIWDLARGYGVDSALARAMSGHLGDDVLIYRITEMQGGYFGIARLVSLTSLPGDASAHTVEFSDIRVFTTDIPYPVGVTTLTRLQLLDDDEFEAITEQGIPALVPAGMMEPRRSFIFDAPTYAEMSGVLDTVRRDARGICALTGEDVGSGLQIAVIWPKGIQTGFRADNFLPFSPKAYEAFNDGHFSARGDFSVLVDLAGLDRSLLSRINPAGKLLVSADPSLRPAADNLAYHRRFHFRLN